MDKKQKGLNLGGVLRRLPDGVAFINGAEGYSQINGTVRFYQTESGVLVVAGVLGLPLSDGRCGNDIFAFHIHGGAACTGNAADPLADAGMHYDVSDCPHPYHSGDMPPLFSAGGTAFLAFLTDRFAVRELIGKTVIIHDMPDDFTTQPSGNAGKKIACGEIVGVKRAR